MVRSPVPPPKIERAISSFTIRHIGSWDKLTQQHVTNITTTITSPLKQNHSALRYAGTSDKKRLIWKDNGYRESSNEKESNKQTNKGWQQLIWNLCSWIPRLCTQMKEEEEEEEEEGCENLTRLPIATSEWKTQTAPNKGSTVCCQYCSFCLCLGRRSWHNSKTSAAAPGRAARCLVAVRYPQIVNHSFWKPPKHAQPTQKRASIMATAQRRSRYVTVNTVHSASLSLSLSAALIHWGIFSAERETTFVVRY